MRITPTRGVTAVLTLALAVLGLVLPAAPALAAPTSLNVSLSIGNSPVWGEPLEVTMKTNYPAVEGVLVLSKIEPGNTRTTLLATHDEGPATVSSIALLPGTHELVATAIKDGVSKDSLVRTVTVTTRPTTTTFQNIFADPLGPIEVQVDSGSAELVPTGSVRFTGGGLDVLRPLDARGIAVLDGLGPGAHAITASYVCEVPYSCSHRNAALQVRRFDAHISGELSSTRIRAGDDAALRVWTEGGHEDYPAAGDWDLVAVQGVTVEPVAVGVHDGSGSFDVDLTDWAAGHLGTWTLKLNFEGGQTHNDLWAIDMGTLTVDEGKADTETIFEPPLNGVRVGGTVTAQVTAEHGSPSGPVSLVLESGAVVATGTAVAGVATLTLPGSLAVGVHNVQVRYDGSETHHGSVSELVPLAVVPADIHLPPGTPGGSGNPSTPAAGKASSAVLGKVVGKRGKAVVTVTVAASARVTGKVKIRDGKRLVRTVALKRGRARLTLRKLRKGKHRITVIYGGSSTVSGSRRAFTVRVR